MPTVEAIREALVTEHSEVDVIKESDVFKEAMADYPFTPDLATGFILGIETARRLAWKSKVLFEAGIDPGDLF